jgi:hypothetical protein
MEEICICFINPAVGILPVAVLAEIDVIWRAHDREHMIILVKQDHLTDIYMFGLRSIGEGGDVFDPLEVADGNRPYADDLAARGRR